jgi:hypothetical protein
MGLEDGKQLAEAWSLNGSRRRTRHSEEKCRLKRIMRKDIGCPHYKRIYEYSYELDLVQVRNSFRTPHFETVIQKGRTAITLELRLIFIEDDILSLSSSLRSLTSFRRAEISLVSSPRGLNSSSSARAFSTISITNLESGTFAFLARSSQRAFSSAEER